MASDAGAERSFFALIGDAFGPYRRHPVLFLDLAAAVIVPYQVVVLLVTGVGPFQDDSLDVGGSFLLGVANAGSPAGAQGIAQFCRLLLSLTASPTPSTRLRRSTRRRT